MSSAQPSPALGAETIPPDEAVAIEQLVLLHRRVQEAVDRRRQPVPRGQHPKQHGCVRAEFIVSPALPPALRHGLFSTPRRYPALARFSNAKQWNDELPDAHGLALKLFDVPGERLPAGAPDARTQDFVLIDHPVFFVKNTRDYVPVLHDFHRLAAGGLLAKIATGLKGALSPRSPFRLLRAMASKRPESPLRIQYWSTTPFRLGAGAMKFSLRPAGALPPSTKAPSSRDKLRLALRHHLAHAEAEFDFLVQLQTDAAAMPIEDPTVAWDETRAPFQKVATLRLPRQTFDTPAQRAFGEHLSFTPWHGISAHRPLGGINRARLKIYEEIASRRHALNEVPAREPAWAEVEALWPLP